MRYAKLLDGKPVYAPNPILHNGLWYGNPPAEILLEQGYKPVTFTEAPAVEPGFVAVPGWEDTQTGIIQTWAIKPEPDEISEERAYRIITGEEE